MGQTTEEGITNVLETYFATPGDFFVGLCSDTSIAKDATYAGLTEVSGSGYAMIALSTIIASTYSVDDVQVNGNEVTFNATGTWTVANAWFVIKEISSGTYVLVCWNVLTAGATTLINGQSIAITPALIGVG